MKPTLSRALVLAFALGVLGSLSLQVAEVSAVTVGEACNNPDFTPEELSSCVQQFQTQQAQNAANQAQNAANDAITNAQLQDAGPQESSGGGCA